jgi:hypothetical protein
VLRPCLPCALGSRLFIYTKPPPTGVNNGQRSLQSYQLSRAHSSDTMHSALLTALLLQTALFVPISYAEELDAGDVPSACLTICQPIVELTNICDVDPRPAGDDTGENDGDDGGSETDEPIEAQCICTNTSFDVSSIAALCASCIQQNANSTVDGMLGILLGGVFGVLTQVLNQTWTGSCRHVFSRALRMLHLQPLWLRKSRSPQQSQ